MLISITACNGGDGDTDSRANPQQAPSFATLEERGDLPKLDRNSAVSGSDNDKNGIRDDIDIFLATKKLDPAKQKAAQQAARAYQRAITVNLQNAAELKEHEVQTENAIACLAEKFGQELIKISNELEVYTINTRERIIAYDAYNKSQDGSVASIPDGEYCE